MNPTALVTGASRGLGLALAHALSDRGWTLLLDARGGAELVAAVRELSGDAHALPGDVADEDHRRALAEASASLGGLDAVVHNASLLGPSPQPTLADYPLAVLRQVYEVNVLAPLRLTQLLLGHLRPDARVLAVTSDAAREPYPGWGGYGSSKAALEQVFAILGAEHPQLRVQIVDPGDMRTRMYQEAFPGEDLSDRPPPEASVPGLVALLEQDLPSGRYLARDLAVPVGQAHQ